MIKHEIVLSTLRMLKTESFKEIPAFNRCFSMVVVSLARAFANTGDVVLFAVKIVAQAQKFSPGFTTGSG